MLVRYKNREILQEELYRMFNITRFPEVIVCWKKNHSQGQCSRSRTVKLRPDKTDISPTAARHFRSASHKQMDACQGSDDYKCDHAACLCLCVCVCLSLCSEGFGGSRAGSCQWCHAEYFLPGVRLWESSLSQRHQWKCWTGLDGSQTVLRERESRAGYGSESPEPRRWQRWSHNTCLGLDGPHATAALLKILRDVLEGRWAS